MAESPIGKAVMSTSAIYTLSIRLSEPVPCNRPTRAPTHLQPELDEPLIDTHSESRSLLGLKFSGQDLADCDKPW